MRNEYGKTQLRFNQLKKGCKKGARMQKRILLARKNANEMSND